MARRKKDCGDEGCGECQVCRYFNFLEWAGQVGGGVDGSVIERNAELDAYIKQRYGITP